jgi:hypothetical protein
MLPLNTRDVAPLSIQSAHRTRQPVRRGNEIVSEPELIAERGSSCTRLLLDVPAALVLLALDVESGRTGGLA